MGKLWGGLRSKGGNVFVLERDGAPERKYLMVHVGLFYFEYIYQA